MAEFCWDCTRDKMRVDPILNDFKDLVEPGHIAQVICEGCGFITINHAGRRISDPLPDPEREERLPQPHGETS